MNTIGIRRTVRQPAWGCCVLALLLFALPAPCARAQAVPAVSAATAVEAQQELVRNLLRDYLRVHMEWINRQRAGETAERLAVLAQQRDQLRSRWEEAQKALDQMPGGKPAAAPLTDGGAAPGAPPGARVPPSFLTPPAGPALAEPPPGAKVPPSVLRPPVVEPPPGVPEGRTGPSPSALIPTPILGQSEPVASVPPAASATGLPSGARVPPSFIDPSGVGIPSPPVAARGGGEAERTPRSRDDLHADMGPAGGGAAAVEIPVAAAVAGRDATGGHVSAPVLRERISVAAENLDGKVVAVHAQPAHEGGRTALNEDVAVAPQVRAAHEGGRKALAEDLHSGVAEAVPAGGKASGPVAAWDHPNPSADSLRLKPRTDTAPQGRTVLSRSRQGNVEDIVYSDGTKETRDYVGDSDVIAHVTTIGPDGIAHDENINYAMPDRVSKPYVPLDTVRPGGPQRAGTGDNMADDDGGRVIANSRRRMGGDDVADGDGGRVEANGRRFVIDGDGGRVAALTDRSPGRQVDPSDPAHAAPVELSPGVAAGRDILRRDVVPIVAERKQFTPAMMAEADALRKRLEEQKVGYAAIDTSIQRTNEEIEKRTRAGASAAELAELIRTRDYLVASQQKAQQFMGGLQQKLDAILDDGDRPANMPSQAGAPGVRILDGDRGQHDPVMDPRVHILDGDRGVDMQQVSGPDRPATRICDLCRKGTGKPRANGQYLCDNCVGVLQGMQESSPGDRGPLTPDNVAGQAPPTGSGPGAVCSVCGQRKPFVLMPRGSGPICRECLDRQSAAPTSMIPGMQCSQCGLWKPAGEIILAKGGSPICVDCKSGERCALCGRKVQIAVLAKGGPGAICRDCEYGSKCSICGQKREIAILAKGGGPICKSCAATPRPAAGAIASAAALHPCSVCGKAQGQLRANAQRICDDCAKKLAAQGQTGLEPINEAQANDFGPGGAHICEICRMAAGQLRANAQHICEGCAKVLAGMGETGLEPINEAQANDFGNLSSMEFTLSNATVTVTGTNAGGAAAGLLATLAAGMQEDATQRAASALQAAQQNWTSIRIADASDAAIRDANMRADQIKAAAAAALAEGARGNAMSQGMASVGATIGNSLASGIESGVKNFGTSVGTAASEEVGTHILPQDDDSHDPETSTAGGTTGSSGGTVHSGWGHSKPQSKPTGGKGSGTGKPGHEQTVKPGKPGVSPHGPDCTCGCNNPATSAAAPGSTTVTTHTEMITCVKCGYSMSVVAGQAIPGNCPKCGYGNGKPQVATGQGGEFDAVCGRCGRAYGGPIADAGKGCPYCGYGKPQTKPTGSISYGSSEGMTVRCSRCGKSYLCTICKSSGDVAAAKHMHVCSTCTRMGSDALIDAYCPIHKIKYGGRASENPKCPLCQQGAPPAGVMIR